MNKEFTEWIKHHAIYLLHRTASYQDDRIQAKKLYNVAVDILGNITFDPSVAIQVSQNK